MLPWLVVALPIAFVITWYPAWHVTLWIDNGTHDRVTVRGNDHELASVAAGSHVETSIPRGAIHITTSAGDNVDIDSRVTTGSWVLNVGRAHCYEWQTFGYAKNENALYFGREAKRYDERLFNVTASWFFRPPPATIAVRKERAIAALPEERAALQIVGCER